MSVLTEVGLPLVTKMGVCHIWDLAAGRCVTTLHPKACHRSCYSFRISVASDWGRVVHFMAADPLINRCKSSGLHVWDLSCDGTQEKYEYVRGCTNSLGF
jgi:hypothetical protein